MPSLPLASPLAPFVDPLPGAPAVAPTSVVPKARIERLAAAGRPAMRP